MTNLRSHIFLHYSSYSSRKHWMCKLPSGSHFLYRHQVCKDNVRTASARELFLDRERGKTGNVKLIRFL